MNDSLYRVDVTPPSRLTRIFSIWYRHFRVYTNNFLSNGFPALVEPLFFLAGISLGLGRYVGLIDGVTFVQFLASGIILPSAMFTASFECTFGTFIRLEFEHVYDGMLASSMNVTDLLVGEMLFAATKGFFFTGVVLVVVSLFGLIPSSLAVFAPFVGFLTGLMFAALSLFITSFVKTINHFNFYFTGLLTPMFFFSGIIFPLTNLPVSVRPVAEIFPLTHSVRLARALCLDSMSWSLAWDLLYIVLFTALFAWLAVTRLTRRLIG